MDAERVRSMLADVAKIRSFVEGCDYNMPTLETLDSLERKLGAELPPVRGTFAGALNGATLKTR